MANLTLVPYAAEHAKAFKDLNTEWLIRYNLLESHDLMLLDNPQGNILDRGGFIVLALDQQTVVGSAALLSEGHDVYELAKMAVSPGYQGRGIARMLMEACLQRARALSAHSIILYSNSQLTRALSMYKQYGFNDVPVVNAPFETADVKMELLLSYT